MASRYKTVILLSKATHQHLCELASKRGQTLEELMQQACASRRGGSVASVRRSPVATEEDEDQRADRIR